MINPGEIEKTRVELNTRLRTLRDKVLIEVLAELKELNVQRAFDTGRMSRSWHGTRRQTGFDVQNLAPYSAYIEYGTPKIQPRHILTDVLARVPNIYAQQAQKLGLKK